MRYTLIPEDRMMIDDVMADPGLLAEQQAFYRHRAPEYDEWWQRRGRYDHGGEETALWNAEVAEVEAALASFGPIGEVLELAGGTGWWTERLAAVAQSLTVVDGSAEVLEINRRRTGRPDVAYVVADLFSWAPDRRYDVVFFSFWLSHVPRSRFGDFWGLVRRCLAPGGRVFLVDSRRDPALRPPDPYVREEVGDVQRRRLNDGSEHRVVKVFYEPDQLAARLAGEGWSAEMYGTRSFVYGRARPATS
ncbi:MAG: class I SAM-dependent methyltransferase [Acidimicrobiales bacterium]